MGLFDVYCQISGLSTFDEKVEALLVVEESPGRFRPLAISLRGRSDRLGGIETEPDLVYDVVFYCLEAKIASGELTVQSLYEDERTFERFRALSPRRYQAHGLDWLVTIAAGSQLGRGSELRLGGRRVHLQMANVRMANAAVAEVTAAPERFGVGIDDASLLRMDPESLFAHIFGENLPFALCERSLGRAGDASDLCRRALREQAIRTLRLCAFLRHRGALGLALEHDQQDERGALVRARQVAPQIASDPALRRALLERYPSALPADTALSFEDLPFRVRLSLALALSQRYVLNFGCDPRSEEALEDIKGWLHRNDPLPPSALCLQPTALESSYSHTRALVGSAVQGMLSAIALWEPERCSDTLDFCFEELSRSDLISDVEREWHEALKRALCRSERSRTRRAVERGLSLGDSALSRLARPPRPPDEDLAQQLERCRLDLKFETGDRKWLVQIIRADIGREVTFTLRFIGWEIDEETSAREISWLSEQSCSVARPPPLPLLALWRALSGLAQRTQSGGERDPDRFCLALREVFSALALR